MIISVNPKNVQLGLGLIGMGKPWGRVSHPVPSDAEAMALLEFAFALGVRYFDTAPSYGDALSEKRLGWFLKSMTLEQRNQVTAATKFGEHWDRDRGEPYADHSLDALRRSLDASMERLGHVDILQLHKTTPESLASDDVAHAWEYARSCGIHRLGPSVSDVDSAWAAIAEDRYTVMQLPFNRENQAFGAAIDSAGARGMWIAVNRPFAMGAMAGDRAGCFRFILERNFSGAILTGTTSPDHLRENWEAFQESIASPQLA
jgi:aryl-alcohol dehydrogenase-like predicted oxidoreductase